MYHQQEVGDYILGRTLGSGTTGKVKIAIHKHDGHQVAIKIVKKSQFEVKPDLQRKIRREVALMRLLDHPHLMKLYDVYESGRHLYMVLEFCAHGELFDYLVSKRRLEKQEAMGFFREIIYGLDYLHAHAICHRDLKPENILLDEFHHVKIADFGFARWMRTNVADTSCGSPHYAAPEVIKGLRYDGRAADIWSCGVILYALLAGRLPFDDPSIRTLLAKVKSGKYVMPDLSDDLRDLISRMLEVDPERRIKMQEIKEHPAFRDSLPRNYLCPTPLPVRTSTEPVDVENMDTAIMNILKGIGYESDEEIVNELTKPADSPAKMFYQMFKGTMAVESLPWDAEDIQQFAPSDEAYLMSPNAVGGHMATDEFGRMRKVPMDIASPETRSFAQPAQWDFAVPTAEIDAQHAFVDIQLDLALLMSILQNYFNNHGFRWFHQDDMSMIVKFSSTDFFVSFRASYASEEILSLEAEMIAGNRNEFEELCAQIQGEIDTAMSTMLPA